MSDTQGSTTNTEERSRVSTKRRTFMGAVGALAGASALGGSAVAGGEDSDAVGGEGSRNGGDAQNAILVIPDGAAQAHISGARYLKARLEDPDGFPLNVSPDGTTLHVDRAERIGGMSTYPDNPDNTPITDSAAAGTAMAAGTKTYSGAISGVGSEDDYTPVGTVLEAAHEAGMATGLVTTTRITHATPATFATHVPDRGMEDEIARQYVDNANVDVLLGGGKRHFDPEERDDGEDLLGRAEEQGYRVVETEDDLSGVDSGKLLGLFGSETDRASHMSYYVDREFVDDTDEPGLVEMTEKAIELLSGHENGFFLMVEAGRVDHQGHSHDNAITYEQLECDEVFGAVLDYAEDDSTPETFAMQVADHETGGMSLGWDAYDMDWAAIESIQASLEHLEYAIGEAGYERSASVDVVEEHTGFELTEGEVIDITGGDLANVLNKRTQMGWSSDSHTAEEVPAYASGPNAEFFGNYFDNTDVSVGIAEALGLDFKPGQEIDYDYQEEYEAEEDDE